MSFPVAIYDLEFGSILRIVDETWEDYDPEWMGREDCPPGYDPERNPWVPETRSFVDGMPALRARLTREMNVSAGAFRLNFITDIPGQQATYLAKEAEARRFVEGDATGGYPYLMAEAGATGSPVAEIAALVLATAAQWRALDPLIEGARRAAAIAIEAAVTPGAARSAATVDWAALLG